MAVRPFVMWPDPRLRRPAVPVGEVTPEVLAILDDLIDTLRHVGGYGLAAPQIGVGLRLAVVDCSPGRDRPVRLIDPEIVQASEETFEWVEASPNLPGVSARLSRPRRVDVACTDHHGLRVRKEFAELWATSVQHQIDHLDGRMFFDRLGPVRRRMLLDRAAKVRRREQRGAAGGS